MINAEPLYWLIGALFMTFAVFVFRDSEHPKRVTSSLFWGLIGAAFIYSTWVQTKQAPAWLLGVVVLGIVALGSSKFTLKAGTVTTTGNQERERTAKMFGNKLFLPVLCIPVMAIVVTLLGPLIRVGSKPLLEPTSATLIGLGLGAIFAVVLALVMFKPTPARALSLPQGFSWPAVPIYEGRRILETIGWAAILPQMLSVLGVLFTQAGVGKAVGTVMSSIIPPGILIFAVIAYCLGMAVFTILMGNAFAAFPIMTAAIGWPLLVQQFGGSPAIVFAIGMLAGFCGTLCTPMAANFNLVPAALLEMKNRYGVITAQLPVAGLMLVANIGIMYFFAFPR